MPMPRWFSDDVGFAHPPRRGDVGRTATSRTEIKKLSMQWMLDRQGSHTARLQADAAALRLETSVPQRVGTRGQMLGIGQLHAGREVVRGKLQQGSRRDGDPVRPGGQVSPTEYSEDEEAALDEGMGGQAPAGAPRDPFARSAGRRDASGAGALQLPVARDDEDGPPPGDDELPPLIRAGRGTIFDYAPPKEGPDLVGWRCMATFPTGPARNFEWHDGFVYKAISTPTGWKYLLFITTDAWTDIEYRPEVPPAVDKTTCFVRSTSKSKKYPQRWSEAERREVQRALAAARGGEAAAEGGEAS